MLKNATFLNERKVNFLGLCPISVSFLLVLARYNLKSKNITRRIGRHACDHTSALVFLNGEHGQRVDLVEGGERSFQLDSHDVLTNEFKDDIDNAISGCEALRRCC